MHGRISRTPLPAIHKFSRLTPGGEIRRIGRFRQTIYLPLVAPSGDRDWASSRSRMRGCNPWRSGIALANPRVSGRGFPNLGPVRAGAGAGLSLAGPDKAPARRVSRQGPIRLHRFRRGTSTADRRCRCRAPPSPRWRTDSLSTAAIRRSGPAHDLPGGAPIFRSSDCERSSRRKERETAASRVPPTICTDARAFPLGWDAGHRTGSLVPSFGVVDDPYD